MSEPTTAPSETAPAEPQEGDADTFDADYVAKIRKEAAKYRTEAKANADAAKRLAEIEDAQKSETERTADRIAKAEAEVATVPAKVADALRVHLVELHKIDKDDAELFLTATDPDLLLKQVGRLIGRQSERATHKGNQVRREGVTLPKAPDDEMAAFTRNLFGQET